MKKRGKPGHKQGTKRSRLGKSRKEHAAQQAMTGSELVEKDNSLNATVSELEPKGRVSKRDDLLTGNKKEVGQDLALLDQAVQQRWPIPQSKRPMVLKRMLGIIAKRQVTVMTKKGDVICVEGEADKNAILATNVLTKMEKQNQDDQLKDIEPIPQQHQHVHVHTTTVDANGVPVESKVVVDPEAEQRRVGLLNLAAALRARSMVVDGVELVGDGAGSLDRENARSA